MIEVDTHVSYLINLNRFINELYQNYYTNESIMLKEEGVEIDGGYDATIYSIAEWIRKKYEEGDEQFRSIIAAMALEYYNQFELERGTLDAVLSTMTLEFCNQFELKEKPNEIIEFMKSCTSAQEFVEYALETPLILEELIDCEVSEVGDEYDYVLVDMALNTNEGREIYKKFHPQYEREKQFDQWWRQVDSIQTKFYSYPIEHFLDYYLLMMNVKEKFSDIGECTDLGMGVLENIDRKDNLLSKQIWFELLRFYYNDVQPERETKQEELDQLDRMEPNELLAMIRYEDDMCLDVMNRFVQNYQIGLFNPKPKNKRVKQFYKKLEAK